MAEGGRVIPSIVVKIDQWRALIRNDAKPSANHRMSSVDGRRIKLIGEVARPRFLRGLECEVYVSNEPAAEAREAGILGPIEHSPPKGEHARILQAVIGVEPRVFRELWRRSFLAPRRTNVTLYVHGIEADNLSEERWELKVADFEASFHN
jgi:hypothetical protein